ncbi:MAG: bifunctional DNA-formamidopyrimidine glycosylase/DNA-(apurinic or apyrimidinic site) lyase [Micrococcaceae bacterium]
MPELPEVETIRLGLEPWLVGEEIVDVEILDPRSLRRHELGDFTEFLTGKTIEAIKRKGKYLWLTFPNEDVVLVMHLGMSGQLLIKDPKESLEKHAKVLLTLAKGKQLRFVDQRIFGGMFLDNSDNKVPVKTAHIALDPLDKLFVPPAQKAREIKRLLLDQTWVSGIGNIYADESLWRAKLYYRTKATEISKAQYELLWKSVKDVLNEAIVAGGTSFDKLYVNTNGESGYFSRSLNVYGRAGEACSRCGNEIVREKFMNRSSFLCLHCLSVMR